MRVDRSAPRILVIGDVMTDVIVRPEGPLAHGSDRRASITFQPGGSAANQAAWLACRGAGVDFVARVGAADVESETARFRAMGVTPHLVGDPVHETGRLIALIDPNGERSFLTDRGANEALEARDISDALIANASHISLSGYSFFSPSTRAAVLDVMRRAGDKPIGVDPASAEFLREVGADNFLAWTRGATILFPNQEEAAVLAGSTDPETQGERLAKHYPVVVIKRGAAGAEAMEGGRRWRIKASGNKPVDISGVRDPGVVALLAQSERRFPVNNRPNLEVVDTTGAGDAFAAGFLAARLTGADIRIALGSAAALGAAASTIVGGQPRRSSAHPG
jgi:sugar/nucleoside kinase (ribokinase family)